MSDVTTPVPEEAPGHAFDESLAQELVERARAEGVERVGPGGVLTDLTSVEARSIPGLLADVVELRLRHESVSRSFTVAWSSRLASKAAATLLWGSRVSAGCSGGESSSFSLYSYSR